MSNRFQRVTQAYRELPWRRRMRWLLGSLAAALVVALVFAFEVHLSAQALMLDYRLRDLQQQTLTEEQDIVVLQTRLAEMQSVEVLLRAAEAQGYKPVSPAQEHFVPVPPNALPETDVAVPQAGLQPLTGEPPLPEAYTISLIHWLSRYLLLEPTP
ncbi:MAG TPA: hypothetical protein ENJ54_11125 [Chloroflexi bacterium]|nr:hypothetical protein [Chloroflexota bacterium]